ncbi:hypothetical protein BSKO_10751 [Bryopsis sp. KO-2023]|nr:hypothetical protein BSKO_10751 [Bryopsis sp. KO-2023]
MRPKRTRVCCEEWARRAFRWPGRFALEYLDELGLTSCTESDMLAPEKCIKRVGRIGDESDRPPDALCCWYPYPKCRYETGRFWAELFFQADAVNREMKRTSRNDRKYNLLRQDLSYLLTDIALWALRTPLIVSHFGLGGPKAIGHGEFNNAIDVLLLMAEMLWEEDVQLIIHTMLRPSKMLNFDKSDPHARAILVCGGFRLVDTLRRRNFDVTEVIEALGLLLGTLLDELQTLNILLKSPRHLERMVETTTLAWRPGLLRHTCDIEDYFKMLRRCDQLLTRKILSHFQRRCCDMSDEADVGRGEAYIACPALVQFLDHNLVVDWEVRKEVLDLAYVLLAIPERKNRPGAARALLERLEDFKSTVSILLSQKFHRREQYADPGDPENAPMLVPCMIRFLAKYFGSRARLGDATCVSAINFATELNGADVFFESTPVDHRNMAITFISHALESVPTLSSEIRVLLTQTWIRALMEPASQKELVYMTTVFSAHPDLTNLVAPEFPPADLAESDSFDARRRLGSHLVSQQQIAPGYSNPIFDKLQNVISIRENELRSEIFETLHWHQNAGAMYLSLMPGIRLSLAGPGLITCCKWVFDAIRVFEEMSFRCEDGTGDFLRVASRGNASKNLQLTGLRLLPDLISTFVGFGAPHGMQRGPDRLNAFTWLMSGFFHLPKVSVGPNHVDLEVLDSLAAALGPCLSDNEEMPKRRALIQFILRYWVGIALGRAHVPTLICERAAINSLQFLQFFFCRPENRKPEVICTYFHWVLPPLFHTLIPQENQIASIASKTRMYIFLQDLFSDEHMVIEPPISDNDDHLYEDVHQIRERSPFQTGDPVSLEDMRLALRVFLDLCMRDVLGCVRYLLAPSQLQTLDWRRIPQYGYRYNQLMSGSREGAEAVAKSESSLAALFGRAPSAPFLEEQIFSQEKRHFKGRTPEGLKDPKALAKASLLFLKTLVNVSVNGAKWALPALQEMKAILDTRDRFLDGLYGIYGQILDGVARHGFDVKNFRPIPVSEFRWGGDGLPRGALFGTDEQEKPPEEDVKGEEVKKEAEEIKEEPGVANPVPFEVPVAGVRMEEDQQSTT